MKSIKAYLRTALPPAVLALYRRLLHPRYLRGNYSNWREALSHSCGYDDPAIFEKLKRAAIEVRDGRASFERDSVLFYEKQKPDFLLTAIEMAQENAREPIRVLDFGGAFGSSYFQSRPFIQGAVEWNVVEQNHIVQCGKDIFSTDTLHFKTLNEAKIIPGAIDLLLLSSVMQYLENPYKVLSELLRLNPRFVLIDRTPFHIDPKQKEQLMVQQVPEEIYSASYPCWVFQEESFLRNLPASYALIKHIINSDDLHPNVKFRGFLLEKKTH